MYKKRIGPFLFLVICCLCTEKYTYAQSHTQTAPTRYRSVQWTMENGIPFDGFHTMIKDVNGFLWIGNSNQAGELSRFDGFTFKKYFPNAGPGTINTVHITAFEEDSLNNIWIGTDKGITRYDIRADSFTNFILPAATAGIENYSVNPFWSTKNEIFCIEAGAAIWAYDIISLKKRSVFRFPKKDNPGVHFNSGHSFYHAGSNSFWFLAYSGPQEHRIQQVLPDGEIKYYNWPCIRGKTVHRHGAEDMVYDQVRNRVWINSGEGLISFSLDDYQFHQTAKLAELALVPDYDREVGIELDNYGRVWFATRYHGLFLYDPAKDELYNPLNDPFTQKQLGEWNLRLYCDQDGIIWSSYFVIKGLTQLLPFDPPVKRYAAAPGQKGRLTDARIYSLANGPEGKLWIGGPKGLQVFDPESEKFELFQAKDFPGLRGKFIQPVYVDTIRKKAWVRTSDYEEFRFFEDRLYEMDLVSKSCKEIKFRVANKYADSAIFEHYMVKPFKNGLIIFDEHYGLFEISENSLYADLKVPFKMGAGDVVLADDRRLFVMHGGGIGNLNASFEYIDGEWKKTNSISDSLKWAGLIYNAKDETFWASFKYEIVHYDRYFKPIRTYKFGDEYNHTAFNLILDHSGNLWFNTILKEICRLDPATGLFTFLSETDGYYRQNYNWNSSVIIDKRGHLYFGETWPITDSAGLDRIFPEKYHNTKTSSVYLKSISVNNRPLKINSSLNELQEISLKYDENLINIETGAIDFLSKGKTRMRYKLEGSGTRQEWQYAPAFSNIRFDGIQPGDYRLIIQSSNSGNMFNSDLKILTIHISPAFWNTVWFRVSFLILLAGTIYLVLRWWLKRKFKMQLDRSEKETQMAEMRQRTAELQQQKIEIEMQALRAQMNPHFIFNSLNSINRFILQNNKAQASEYLTKFSRLVRLILQNSQSSLISLESEIEALRLYLDLEAVRFEHRFAYSITVPKDMDIEMLKVPPLIIQPYTENAIWHGLMHKEEKGQLDISVDEENEHLVIRIADNGIGREAARTITGKSATKHKSFGMKITASRIAMLEKEIDGQNPVMINDMVNPDGIAAGTEVIIKIPLIV